MIHQIARPNLFTTKNGGKRPPANPIGFAVAYQFNAISHASNQCGLCFFPLSLSTCIVKHEPKVLQKCPQQSLLEGCMIGTGECCEAVPDGL